MYETGYLSFSEGQDADFWGHKSYPGTSLLEIQRALGD